MGSEPSPRALSVVFLVAVLPFLRTLGFEHTYDDHAHVVRNPFLKDPGNAWALLTRYFELEVADQSRPVLLWSHFLDRAIGGDAAWAGHLQSSLWHGAVAVLVCLLGRRIGLTTPVALGAGVLFAVHPACVEAVAGISNREDVLTTVFSLLSLLALSRALPGRVGYALLAALFYALALGAKELAIVVPLLAGLLALAPSFRGKATRRGVGSLVIALGLVSAGFTAVQLRLGTPGLLRGAGSAPLMQATHRSLSPPVAALSVHWLRASPASPPPPGARQLHHPLRPEHGLSVQGFRLVQLAFGHPLSAEHDLRPLSHPLGLVFGALIVALAGLGAWVYRRPSLPIGVALGFVFVSFVPVGLPTLLINPLADRYLYMPAVGASWALSLTFLTLLPTQLKRPVEDVGTPLGLLWASAFLALSIRATGHWQNDVTLFAHAALSAPTSARAHQNLGAALMERRRGPEAEVALLRAAELDPSLLAARYNLGVLAEQDGRPSLAIERYQAALANPSVRGELPLRARTVDRLGRLLLRTGRFDDLARLVDRERDTLPDSEVVRELTRRLEAHPRRSPSK